VVAVGGDGDGLSIGIGHFPHAARRNVDITYIMLDNRIYGLTKGQSSPTTCQGQRTKSSPDGVVEVPLNPIELAITFGSSFVARGFSGKPKQLKELIEQAIVHRGFSLVHLLSPCVTFGKDSGFDFFRPRVKPLPSSHDPADRWAALTAAHEGEKIFTGVFYQVVREEFITTTQARGGARGRELDDSAPAINIDALIQRFS
jgi:2-oxoglutarate ferredoxin oxidoreductase subunit beta